MCSDPMSPLKVLYCHGLGSSINNRTGQALVEYFKGKPHYFERLLYRNPGSDKKLWRISEWREDIENRIGNDEWVLMATSAGAHAALNVAKSRPQNVKGLFLFCPGVSLSLSYVDRLAPGAVGLLQKGAELVHPASRNGHPALVDLHGFQLFLDTCVTKEEGSIPIKCPVGIVHGTLDDTVPFENSLKLAERLETTDVKVTLIQDGTHYLEFDDVIRTRLDQFLDKLEKKTAAKL